MKLFAVAVVFFSIIPARADENVTVLRNRRYKQVGDTALLLDLYLPRSAKPTPLVVWIHGGGWRAGSKNHCPITWMTDHGYAVASIGYRLSDQAIFPAQIHDCKSAVRALRAKADKYNINPDKIAVAGSSAGGHLSALIGTSGGVSDLADPNDKFNTSDAVQAVIDIYGPANMITITQNSRGAGGPVEQLFGGPVRDNKQAALQASPVTHIDAKDPPTFIIHGEDDRLVPVRQSIDFAAALKKANVPVTLEVVKGMAHSHRRWMRDDDNRKKLIVFLREHLK